ncbi:hypothetical protein BST83_13220 [Polaribacter filamentus]|uniref:Uncharacterized protein n=1 Tax=Polaribacter filamentus TaxID=53483 RepID=A0A2S7KZB6_9FLAO|nr:toprim domain-containing protein [Polaribacter filamentus]PQB08005.1 hypothetical protein BST83_13220 [Polaribacter filamentus]
MSNFPFAEAILHQTDGGLQIIKDYYPEAASVGENSTKKFKMRADEKTASAALKKTEDGTWLVIDWGQWDKPKNGIFVCMFEDNLTFGEACKKLAKLYQIQYQNTTYASKPIITKRAKTKDEVPGSYLFDYKEELSAEELLVIGPEVSDKIATRFHLKAVKSYSYVKENEVTVTQSTEEYPVLVYDFGSWQKIYQPKSADKSFRFRYAGGRPKDYIFGLDDVENAAKKHKERVLKEAGEDSFPTDKELKLENIIVCSGDRDAINVASFGYYVIWLNSETASLTNDLYNRLKKLANHIYNLPDIDKTGVKQAVKVGLDHLDIKTIWLPKYLLQTKDWRGNPRKDFLDFVNLKYNKQRPVIVKNAFKKLIVNSLPMKFWDEQITDNGTKYHYNIVHAEHFLKHQGFCRMETPFEKEEYCYIYIDGNIVKRTSPNKIENFVNNFLEERQMPIPLRNMVKKTPYLKESMLSKLPVVEVDFVDCDANSQYWFFKKNVVEIRKDVINIHKNGVVDKMVIDEKVIDFPERTTERQFEAAFKQPHFKIGEDLDGDLDITVLKKDNKWFNYLINASRIHWQKELEGSFKPSQVSEAATYFKENQFNIAGPNLEEDEILEQKQHLINKLFAIGYLLHKYKVKSKAWFVFGIDNKLSDIGESHGGSGKSLMYDYLEKIMKAQFFIPGRSKKAVDSDFLFDGVSKETDYVFIDDMNQYFPFQQFFSEITGKMKVNPKGTSGFTINFEDSPKLCGTSNFPPNNLDPSSSRRILFTVNSDYYHHNKDNEYRQTRRVSDDFNGKDLFNDFTESEYLDFYVFCAQTVQFYLSCSDKIDPPMDNVNKRNLMAEMGDAFRNWASVYFHADTYRLDTDVIRTAAFDDYKKVSGGKKSSNNFKKSVKAFCTLNNYVLDPKEAGAKNGRIIKNIEGKSQECFYIKTKETNPTDTLEDNELLY